MVASGFRDPCLSRVQIDALCGNARQGVEVVVSQSSKLLKISEIILRGGRSNDCDNANLNFTTTIYPARPCALHWIVLDRRKPLRPNIPCRIILREHPDCMSFRELLQCPSDRITKTATQRLTSAEKFLRSRRNNLDFVMEDRSSGGHSPPSRLHYRQHLALSGP
jgi:hypothetical protein